MDILNPASVGAGRRYRFELLEPGLLLEIPNRAAQALFALGVPDAGGVFEKLRVVDEAGAHRCLIPDRTE